MNVTATKNQVLNDSYFNDLRPYTIEELDARLEEAEDGFAQGRSFSREEAHIEMRKFLASL